MISLVQNADAYTSLLYSINTYAWRGMGRVLGIMVVLVNLCQLLFIISVLLPRMHSDINKHTQVNK